LYNCPSRRQSGMRADSPISSDHRRPRSWCGCDGFVCPSDAVAGLAHHMGMDDRRRRRRARSAHYARSVAADQRLVCAVLGNFGVPADRVVAQEICGLEAVGLCSTCGCRPLYPRRPDRACDRRPRFPAAFLSSSPRQTTKDNSLVRMPALFRARPGVIAICTPPAKRRFPSPVVAP